MASSSAQVEGLVVRAFQPADRAAVRSIALATAMTGLPSSEFFDGDDLLADALTGYFTDNEPESCFVAEINGTVAGYLIGARDTRVMDACFNRKGLFPLIRKTLAGGYLFRRKNMLLLCQVMKAAVTGRLWVPDFSRDYPATLHINLLPSARGFGAGGRLMAAFLEYLSRNHVSGVRLATMSDKAGQFFASQGFHLLFRSSRPYFYHIIQRDVPLLVYGKRCP